MAYLEGPAAWYTAEKVRASRKAAFVHVEYGKAGYRRALDEGAYGSFGRVYCVSREVRESFLHAYPRVRGGKRSCAIIRSAARASCVWRGRKKFFLHRGAASRILTVGRLHPMKGCDIAVEAARLLKEQGRRFCWVVLGEGPERARLTRQIRRSGLQSMFLLPGARQNPYPWFRAADLYVCASRYEGKSLVVEEAQLLGCPVVTLPCTGVEEQVEDGVSGLIVSGSAPELAAAIASLMDDAQRRAAYGRRAAEKPAPPDEGPDRLRAFLNG